jgi:hypothetical protein
MEIAGSARIPPTLTLANVPATAAWQVGQRLDATVVSINDQNKVSLQIGTAILEARTSLATAVGQKLQLEVVRNDNQIILRIISPALETDPLAAALRAALPRQLPLQTVLASFTGALASSSELPHDVAALLKQILLEIPSQQTIARMDTLKQALLDSGPFLEHKLSFAPKPPSLNQDLKGNLLRLLAALDPNRGGAIADLQRQAEAGLARIQLHQLSMLSEAQTAGLAWTGELPLRHGDRIDVLQFRIEKDSGNGAADAEQQSWSTLLSINLPALGPLHAKITLANKNVSTIFWAESSAAATIVNQHLDFLRQSLDEAGLTVKGLQCLQGRPPFPTSERVFRKLLDLTA